MDLRRVMYLPKGSATRYMLPGLAGLTDKQAIFLRLNDVPEILYGGAAGGGKSIALLLAALQYVDVPGYSAILLRRTYSDLALPGALMDRAAEWLSPTDAKWDGQNHIWRFPSGASLSFGYLDCENQKYRYQSAEFQFIGIDESTQLTESQIRYMFSRLRRSRFEPVPLRFRLASNPGGVSHEWHKARYVNSTSPGRVYLPARLDDNPHLDKQSYMRNLDQLDPITRKQLLEGDWSARHEGQFFCREWFDVADAAPRGVFAAVRAWDLAASRDGKRTVGVKLCKHIDGTYTVAHVVKGKWTPGTRDKVICDTAKADGRAVRIVIEQEPGSGGIAQVDSLVKQLAGYRVSSVHATGSKESRAGPVASYAERGFIRLVRGEWLADFIDELESFPSGEYSDQVDALAHAFMCLADARAPKIPRRQNKNEIDGESSGRHSDPWNDIAPHKPIISDFVPT